MKSFEILELSATEANTRWETGTVIGNRLLTDKADEAVLKVWNIHSIRRLSDGVIFTIGQGCHHNNGNYYGCNIHKFKITQNPEWGLERYRNKITMKVVLESNIYPERLTEFELDSVKLREEKSDAKKLHDYQRKYNDAVKEMNDYMLTALAEELRPKPKYNRKLLLLL